MTLYQISVTVCEKCGEHQVRYPVIKLGPKNIIVHNDILCQCEKEEKLKKFEKYFLL